MQRLLALLLLFPLLAQADPLAEDPAELQRTWEEAWVTLPSDSRIGYERLSVEALPTKLAEGNEALPVVVYAHGCTGLNETASEVGRFLARAGYLVIAPDSFARAEKPVSCNPVGPVGGLHREVLGWRQAEVKNAIERARTLPNVDPERVFLMGFSEGGITTATMSGVPVAGRVIEGWTCHAGWSEYKGLNAPPEEPVLAIVAAEDPWFQEYYLRGDCGAFMQDRSNAASLVIDDPPFLKTRHWLSFRPEIQAEILEFLDAHS